MLECLLLGDSIASGIADIRRDCTAYVQSGINSHDWNKKYLSKAVLEPAAIVAISLGSNDTAGIHTREELEALRAALAKNNRVLWIIPAIKPRIKEIVYAVATAWEDDILEISGLSSDGVHPTRKGYKALAEHIK